MKRTGLLVAVMAAIMMVIPSMASDDQDIIIDGQDIIVESQDNIVEGQDNIVEVQDIIIEGQDNIIEEENPDPVIQDDYEALPTVSQETDELVIESVEEVPIPETESNVPSTLAVTYFDETVNIGDSTSFWIYLTANFNITLVSEDDSIATASITGTSISVSTSGTSYGRHITVNGYKEGATAININSGSSTIGIINVEVLVETEDIGTQHVDSTYTTTVVSTSSQSYSVDTDAVSIKSSSTSKQTSTTSVNGNSTTTVTYTTTITLSMDKTGNYDFNIIGSSSGRVKNFKADVVEHIWNGFYTVDVEPTTTSEGSESIHCSVCNEIDPDTVTVLPMKEKTDISTCAIELDSTTFTYDGTEKKPGVTVYDGSTKLTSSDYELSYSNDINAGTAAVIITAKGDNYKGEAQRTYTIEKANISNCTVTLAKTQYTYDGSAKTPSVTLVKSGSRTLTSGEDYTISYSNNTNAGTAKVKITGTGNYTGSATTTFTITKIDMSNLSVKLSATTYTYNGSAKKPSVTVKNGSKTLTSGTDYTVSYSNNTNAGTATVTVTGKGNYTGTVKKNFTINKVSQTITAKVAASSIEVGKTMAITASGKGTISYSSSNTSVATVSSKGVVAGVAEGTATITVKAAGNSNYKSGSTTLKITVILKQGSSYTSGDFVYKILTIPSSGKGTVRLTRPVDYSIEKAAIPAKVEIGGRVFKVTEIGVKAFKGCKNLTTVSTGKNVTAIGNQAFQGCTSMTGVSIQVSTTAIGKKAFYNCQQLKKIVIKSKQLTSVGKNAFKGTKSNAKIKVPKSNLKAYKKLLKGKGFGKKVTITS